MSGHCFVGGKESGFLPVLMMDISYDDRIAVYLVEVHMGADDEKKRKEQRNETDENKNETAASAGTGTGSPDMMAQNQSVFTLIQYFLPVSLGRRSGLSHRPKNGGGGGRGIAVFQAGAGGFCARKRGICLHIAKTHSPKQDTQ